MPSKVEKLQKELHSVKQELDKQNQRIRELKNKIPDHPTPTEALGLDTPTKRRQALAYLIGAGGMGSFAASQLVEPARADAAGADAGTQADPYNNVYAHTLAAGDGADVQTLGDAIQHANEAVSSATTIGNVCYIEVDTTASSFQVTIPASLEKSGVELRFIDAGGNAGTNSFDLTSTNWNIDGSATLTVDVSDVGVTLYPTGSQWITSRFVDTLDARTINTDKVSTTNPTGTPTDVAVFNPGGRIVSSGDFTLSDDSTKTIVSPFGGNEAGFAWALDKGSQRAAIFSIANDNVSILEQAVNQWQASDTDGASCLFVDASDNLLVKNRTGSNETYRVMVFMIQD